MVPLGRFLTPRPVDKFNLPKARSSPRRSKPRGWKQVRRIISTSVSLGNFLLPLNYCSFQSKAKYSNSVLRRLRSARLIAKAINQNPAGASLCDHSFPHTFDISAILSSSRNALLSYLCSSISWAFYKGYHFALAVIVTLHYQYLQLFPSTS